MKKQVLGAALLDAAFVLFLFGEIGISYIALLLAGLLDLYLVWKHEQTISQWVQDLTHNKVVDYVVLTALTVSSIFVFTRQVDLRAGLTAALPIIWIGLALHLFANKD